MNFLSNLFGKPVSAVSPTDAQQKLSQNQKPFLLDVRQPEEFVSGHIQGAKLIPLGELHSRIRELPKDREIICVCRSGNRSLSATRLLHDAGYEAANLHGGMIAWSRLGLPVRKGK